MTLNIGIYNLNMQAMGGGEKLTLVLAEHLSLDHKVWLFCAEPIDIPSLERFFEVDLSRVTTVPLEGLNPISRVVATIRRRYAPALALHHYSELRKFNLDILINNSYASSLKCPAARGIFMCMFPHPILGDNSVDSYSLVVAISQYSADWISKMWNRRAEIIYPPCDDMGPPGAKAKMILHVGRFIANNNDAQHHKAQGLMLDAFKRLTYLHKDGWELHFVGSIGPDKRSAKFVKKIVQNATGFPVFFHFNATREEIRDLYRRAAIYWHATGYGFDVKTYPAKQEHFGISTVEAMSAGAVPVVYASGGQQEIVTDKVDGFWWNDVDALIIQTAMLAEDRELRDRAARQAIRSSKRFGKPVFAAQIDQVIAKSLTARF